MSALPHQHERRRHPRFVPGTDVRLSVPVVANAEVLDISSEGALISTSAPLHDGQRAHLRILLQREPFSAWIEVRRLESGTAVGTEQRHRVGATFTVIDDNSQRTLQRFISASETPERRTP